MIRCATSNPESVEKSPQNVTGSTPLTGVTAHKISAPDLFMISICLMLAEKIDKGMPTNSACVGHAYT